MRRGFSVSEYWVTNVETGEGSRLPDEEELYALLGYAYIPPELRENGGELDAARNDELPALVELGDLRGDLHSPLDVVGRQGHGRGDGPRRAGARARRTSRCATTRSACATAGWSRSGRRSTRSTSALAPFRILKGIEVNIRANGELDVADEILEQLDWVMASVHTSFDKDPTERVLRAMENPHVDCIGHLTSRRIGVRNPSTIEVEKVVEAALETGTFLEINSQPDRLDLRDAHARLARGGRGDARDLERRRTRRRRSRYVELGVGQARRAWLTKEQILNTRPWKAIEKLRK